MLPDQSLADGGWKAFLELIRVDETGHLVKVRSRCLTLVDARESGTALNAGSLEGRMCDWMVPKVMGPGSNVRYGKGGP